MSTEASSPQDWENEVAWLERATIRVKDDPRLRQYYDLCIEYDWPWPVAEHYRWVTEAPIAEIIDWAETIRMDEQQGASKW